MNRRNFIRATAALGACGAIRPTLAMAGMPEADDSASQRSVIVPDRLGGMTLKQLRDDYHDRLFNHYLPFWDKGGYDRQLGGFTCELNDDGSIAKDEKYIWYQGRGIWVYSFLYRHFGQDPQWLRIAQKSRDFMVNHMHAGQGRWYERVRRDGSGQSGTGENVYGWLFAALGLVGFHAATDDRESLALAKESLWAAVRAYDDPAYTGAFAADETFVDMPKVGLRAQGHSMCIMWLLSQLLRHDNDPRLHELQARHVNFIANQFWNSELGIVNEYLLHDYSRIPGAEDHMFAGHALETLWMLAEEAVRIKDRKLFDTAVGRIHRLLEMCWDYVFEGWGTDDFFVFGSDKHPQGPNFAMKTMWGHCEILVACLLVLEYTGAAWAKEWYDRVAAYTLRTMPSVNPGIWRQAVDRRGKDVKRTGISSLRRDNFHPPRCFMLNLLRIQRMIDRGGILAPFPS